MPCNICNNPLDVPGDPSTTDHGGDCQRCMAEIIADPDAIRGMRDEVPGWWDSLDESRRNFFIETLESDGPQMSRPVRRTPNGLR